MKGNVPPKILDSVESIPLPPLPQVLVRFLALVEDEAASLEEVATVVALDPALTAHLLTVANSPFFRTEAATYNLQHCLAAIGRRMLRTIAAAMTVQNSCASCDQNRDYTGFWANSLQIAELARSLAMAANYPDPEEAYLAGLLHDIGQLLLVSGVAEGYSLDAAPAPDRASIAGSQNSPDVAFRALLGSRLVEHWGLSSFMADALLFHRRPVNEIASADLLSRIAWSAHKLSGCNADDASPGLLADIAIITALIGIDAPAIAEACSYSGDRVAKAAALLGIDLSRSGQVFLRTSFITQEQSFSQGRNKNAAGLQLEAQVRTMAVMHSLQESLLSLSGAAELYGALRESARILFGLGRPAFLVVHPNKPILVGADVAGQSPLLTRLEIQLDSVHSLAAAAIREDRPRSSWDNDYPATPFLSDIQLGRTLHSEGLLCVPMRHGKLPVGVMVYGVTAERYARTRGSLDWITGFAAMAARTLETCHLLAERNRQLTAEIINTYEQRARKVAHEVANPLSIINNYLQIVAEKLGEQTGVGKELEILKEEIARVERIIRHQGDHAGHTPAMETVNVNSVIEGMLALYSESLFETHNIAIEKHLAPELPVTGANRDNLKQILLNLWKNSAEAMSTGGRLSITTRATKDKECSGVEIRLTDTGPGIPADVMACLFQPLDPDRRPAHSGIGLSIVASLVERNGGKIFCESSPDKGTDFTILLPQVQQG